MNSKSHEVLGIRDIHKDFRGLEVLKGVDMVVKERERHAVIGPNGAGKTTLFHIITGSLKPSQGQIHYQGNDISRLPIHKRSRLGMSRSFQVTNIFSNLTVFDNVLAGVRAKYGLRYNLVRNPHKVGALRDKTDRIIEKIGLMHAKHRPARELAYGEQRALEIGIALSTEPTLILLDEPTAGMTREDTRAFIQMIDMVTRDLTLVIIEHDMDVVFSLASTLSVLHYGTILVSGEPDQVRKDQRVKDAYLGEDQ
ncbi:MAG: ABC transporter ATP-binding protein [Deltaproteobacteria bacterium]|nr:ABC transporter ATP-binding protein [Deltaproteobacteria bacterium]